MFFFTGYLWTYVILFLWSYASGGDNIGINFKKLHFNEDTINSLNKFAKSYRFKITYFYGYLVKFDKANIHAISPHKILFSKNDDNLYFVDGEKQPFTMTAIKKYIRDYFKKNI